MEFIQKYEKVNESDDANDDMSVASGDEVNDSDDWSMSPGTCMRLC